MMLIWLALWIAIFFILLQIVIWSVKNGISPAPTSIKVLKALLNQLPLEVKGKIYDLGSGVGSLAHALAKRYPKHQVIGIESSPLPYLLSCLYLRLFPLNNLRFIKEDFFKSSLQEGGLILCYLYPKAMEQLKEKLLSELSQESWVISHTFAISGWKTEKIVVVDDLYQTKIYIYKVSSQAR